MENYVTVNNREKWYDSDGSVIHAHGGWILQEGAYFYWFGENRTERKKVSCYRSTNLKDWEFRNDVLGMDSIYKTVYYRTFPDMNPTVRRGLL